MSPYAIIPVMVIGVIGAALLFWAAQCGKPTADPETGTLIIRYNAVMRGFALVFAFGFPLGLTVMVLCFPLQNGGEVWGFVFSRALFAVLGCLCLWESFRFSLGVSPEGLDCRSPWRRGRFIVWNEVEEVSFSNWNDWFIIRAADGWKFRVTWLVPGLSQFLERCEMYLPLETLAKAKPGYRLVGRPFPEWPQEPR